MAEDSCNTGSPAENQPMTASGGNFIGWFLIRNKRSPQCGVAPIETADSARYADALIAFRDGKSAGTRDMIRKAEEKGLSVQVHLIS